MPFVSTAASCAARPWAKRATSASPSSVESNTPWPAVVSTPTPSTTAQEWTPLAEVNIKILLDRIVDNGDLTGKQRNSLLAEMTDEVAAHVLNDNYGQNVAIACRLWQAPSLADVHARYMRFLERRGFLNRALEFLPTDRQLAERRTQGRRLAPNSRCCCRTRRS